MKRRLLVLSGALLPFLCALCPRAQMPHAGTEGTKREDGPPSKTLTLTGLHGETKTLTPDDLKTLPHVAVTVLNTHLHRQETYRGVPAKNLLALVASSPTAGAPHASPRTTIVLAGATDHFQVALAVCDLDPGCRSGQAIVADTVDGKPLTSGGAFTLILTEDKTPSRWVRNLDSLAEKNVGTM